MSREAGDTHERSLAHWSEQGRDEMDAFYRVASLDYRELAQAWDWDTFLRQRVAARSTVRILDVACGSGKFPTALRAHTALGSLDGSRFVLDLLDPSAFSLREARASLAPPMVGGRDFECTLQAIPADATGYDVVWAVHALYALPEAELPAGVEAFLGALASDGLGFVAHATRSAHYLAFYEAYLSRYRADDTPYACGEAVADAFRDAGAKVEVRPLVYEQVIEDDAVLEGFLQRCLFDSELSLDDMRRDPVLGAYLDERRDAEGRSRFRQDVSMIFVWR
ncbi:MAG: class I SAM-dependent methyltransferase [Myxococcota bacterium]